MCLNIFITDYRFNGWKYTFFIFTCLPFALCLIFAFLYLRVLLIIKRSSTEKITKEKSISSYLLDMFCQFFFMDTSLTHLFGHSNVVFTISCLFFNFHVKYLRKLCFKTFAN